MIAKPAFSLLWILACCLLGGCANTLVARAETTAASRIASIADERAVASALTVADAHGEVRPADRVASLRRLGDEGREALLQRQLAAMVAFGDVRLYEGTDSRLLVDGPETFAAMFDAIARARRTILLESYIIDDAEVARSLARLLLTKRAEGVQVAVIYDDIGSITTPDGYFEEMRRGGVMVCAFNPVSPLRRPGYWDITHRDHRKILVVDDRIAFTGGINISGVYASGSSQFGRGRDYHREAGWRDTQLQLRGPAVEPLAILVRQTWLEQGCEGGVPGFDPGQPSGGGTAGDDVAWVIASSPDDERNRIYAMLLAAIDASVASIHLTMAYFAPGEDMVAALEDAARRGVEVQLILPSQSDFRPVLYAGRSYYQRLLDAGVDIHEFGNAVLHAKTAVIDGVISTVGSSNMDWRSFGGNNEVNVVVLGRDFARRMQAMFQDDLAASRRITPEAWAGRALHERLLEGLARVLEPLW
ncbi:MAG: cardiolipin synthase B [Rhodocyclaceae bacterium]|nr:cardiolipin synthase B [Rhodocyclaceae bacterium]